MSGYPNTDSEGMGWIDYSTDEQLKTIETWKADDLHGLMAYIKPIWKYSDCGYWEAQENGSYTLHTAGWSGNEEIIAAMMRNQVWWLLFWYQSNRGGHYIFQKLTY